MADISAALIKELRERTGVGLMDCKKSLIESQGDIELAIDKMRKSILVQNAKKTTRSAREGIILIKLAPNCKFGLILEINCETDFVARNCIFKAFGDEIITVALNKRIVNIKDLRIMFEEKRTMLISRVGENISIYRIGMLDTTTNNNIVGAYLHNTRIGVIVSITNANKELAKHIAMHIAASKPEYISSDDIPNDVINRERKIQLEIATQSNKPYTNIEKIVEGRMLKFISRISLNDQTFILDLNKTVGKLLSEKNARVDRFIRFEVGEGVLKTQACFDTEAFKNTNTPANL